MYAARNKLQIFHSAVSKSGLNLFFFLAFLSIFSWSTLYRSATLDKPFLAAMPVLIHAVPLASKTLSQIELFVTHRTTSVVPFSKQAFLGTQLEHFCLSIYFFSCHCIPWTYNSARNCIPIINVELIKEVMFSSYCLPCFLSFMYLSDLICWTPGSMNEDTYFTHFSN